jgi:hypothetical protein
MKELFHSQFNEFISAVYLLRKYFILIKMEKEEQNFWVN